jgi:glyceraldehyde-3-phosphate dehydrogenase (NADP+)
MQKEYKFLIGGEWRSSSKKEQVLNPYDNKVVGVVFQASPQDIDDAVVAAQQAFEVTREMPSYRRAEILQGIVEGIRGKKDELAELMARESGKPIQFAKGEVERSILTFTVAAEEAKDIHGDLIPLDLASHSEGRIGIVRRFPIGPIAGISPFNFPMNLIAHKVGPCIASGNTMVLKPPSSCPITGLTLAGIIQDAGAPRGMFNIIPCRSSEAEAIVTDERIKMLSFTGSPEVGWYLKSKAGKKRVTLELGGNAGVLVDRDANLDFAVRRIAIGSYGNSGQSCIAVQRIYVHSDIYDEFESRFLEETKRLKVGDPMDGDTVVGPMIDENAAKKVESWIQEAVAGGASVLWGGRRNGAVLEPTIVVGAERDMKVSCLEVFAPVVTLDRFESFEDAIDMINDSKFGLQAGVFTNDLKKVFYAYKKLDVGGVIINDYPTYRIDSMPYGGVKESGFGREGVKYAIEEMTEMKLLVFNLM